MYTEEDIITQVSLCENSRAGYNGYYSYIKDKFYNRLFEYGDTPQESKNKLIILLKEKGLWNENS